MPRQFCESAAIKSLLLLEEWQKCDRTYTRKYFLITSHSLIIHEHPIAGEVVISLDPKTLNSSKRKGLGLQIRDLIDRMGLPGREEGQSIDQRIANAIAIRMGKAKAS